MYHGKRAQHQLTRKRCCHTTEKNSAGSAFIGNGIYKSTNAGETWTHLGLTQESIISKIRVNPIDTNIIYVAAMGLPFEKHNNYCRSYGVLDKTKGEFTRSGCLVLPVSSN